MVIDCDYGFCHELEIDSLHDRDRYNDFFLLAVVILSLHACAQGYTHMCRFDDSDLETLNCSSRRP
jgi:hypothetical protein